jgi:hypothetical protein
MEDVMNKLQQSNRGADRAPKLERVLGQLRELEKRQQAAGQSPVPDQTVADDKAVSDEVMRGVLADEALVRPVLELVGVDYDALVAMDGISPYSQAVGANEALLEQVMQAERPVLAALNVALGFKPYAEFVAKYGADPAGIKDKLRQEILAEQAAPAATTAARGAVFSAPVGKREAAKQVSSATLESVFKR